MDPRIEPFPFQGMTFGALGERAYVPVMPTRAMGFTDDESWEVVGESRYMAGIRRLKALIDADTDDDLPQAVLIAEPSNPFDRHAVRVDLLWDGEQETCGYLPREHAYRIQPLVKKAADDALLVFRNAMLFGGTAEKPNIGVWLVPPNLAPGTQQYDDFIRERNAS